MSCLLQQMANNSIAPGVPGTAITSPQPREKEADRDPAWLHRSKGHRHTRVPIAALNLVTS